MLNLSLKNVIFGSDHYLRTARKTKDNWQCRHSMFTDPFELQTLLKINKFGYVMSKLLLEAESISSTC